MVLPICRIVPDVSDAPRLSWVRKVGTIAPGAARTLTGVPAALAPRLWLGHLLALVLVGAAGLLGVWQVDAWQTRRADEARDLTRADPVALSSVMGPDDPFPGRSVGQPVILEGDWLATGTVFVSDRERDGHDGYWMVTPLAIGGADQPAMPVVLGWVADPTSAPAPPEGSADLVGWLQPPEGTGAVDDDPGDDVLPQLRIADLVAARRPGPVRRLRRRPATASPGCPPPSWSSSPTPAGSPRSATSSTRSSGGSSAPSRC